MVRLTFANGNIVECTVEELQSYVQLVGPLPNGTVIEQVEE